MHLVENNRGCSPGLEVRPYYGQTAERNSVVRPASYSPAGMVRRRKSKEAVSNH